MKTAGAMGIKRNWIQDLIRNRTLLWMTVPSILIVFVFSYLPMLGIVIAFKEFNVRDGIFKSPWVGLDNFKFFFGSGKAWTVTWHTVFYNLMFLFACTAFAILIALFLSEIRAKFFKKVSQAAILLPYFISWVVVSAFVYNLFNTDFGAFSVLARSMGREPMNIYTTPQVWYFLLPMFKVWKMSGYWSVIYLAAIMSIDQECYESADMDGASVFQKVTRITIPMILPTMILLMLLQLGNIVYGDFDMFYQLIGQNGMLYQATDIIDTFVFRSVLFSRELGMVSAAGFYQSIVGFVLVMTVNGVVRKVRNEYALF